MDNNNLPTSVNFILAEDMRDEPNNKKTLLGFYGGDEILVQRPADVAPDVKMTMPSLVILAILKGQFSNVQGNVRLRTAGGNDVLDSNVPDITSGDNNSAVVAIRLSPFHIDAFGPYNFKLTLNGAQYDYVFKVAE